MVTDARRKIHHKPIVRGVLWLYYLDQATATNPGDGSLIPEPTAAPTDSQGYAPGAVIGGWTVLDYRLFQVALDPADKVHTSPTGTVGTYKYISYVEVDLDQNAVGDRYLRSADSPLVPFAVATDTFEVKITGLDMVLCGDFFWPSPSVLIPNRDLICEPYWKFKLNGTDFNTGNRLKRDAVAISLSPGLVKGFKDVTALPIERARTNGACITVQGDIYDRDYDTSSSAGDEHGSFTSRQVCYNNGWGGLNTDPTIPKEYILTVTLSGGKIGWPVPYRTQYKVFYTVRKCDDPLCAQ